MKKQQTPVVLKLFALVFAAFYVAGSFANMLSVPRYAPNGTTAGISGASAVRPYVAPANVHFAFMQLFDKSTFDNDVLTDVLFTPLAIDLFCDPYPQHATANGFILPQNPPLYNYQYSYLSFCTFRI